MTIACPSNYSLEPLAENANAQITCLPLSSYWHNEKDSATANAIGESLHHKKIWQIDLASSTTSRIRLLPYLTLSNFQNFIQCCSIFNHQQLYRNKSYITQKQQTILLSFTCFLEVVMAMTKLKKQIVKKSFCRYYAES